MNWIKNHKVLSSVLTLLAVVILAAAIGLLNQGSQPADKTQTNQQQTQPTEPAKTVKVGEATRDGKFEFVVQKVNCGRNAIGSGSSLVKAHGEFCVANVRVKNIGNSAQTLFEEDQYAFNAEDRRYSVNIQATNFLRGQSNVIYEKINPGNSVQARLVFDKPKDVELTRLELHDSSLSSGVEISLK